MVTALVGLVVVALIVFLLLKKKASPPRPDELNEAPFTTPSKQVESRSEAGSARAHTESATAGDQSRAAAEVPSGAADHPSHAQDSHDHEPATDLASDRQSVDAKDGTIEGETESTIESAEPSAPEAVLDNLIQEEAEPGSPPPPPVRGTPAPPSIGNRAALSSLRKGLAKSRQSEGFFGRLKGLLTGRKEIDPTIAEDIEEVLLTSDVGVKTTEVILERIKTQLQRGELKDEAHVWQALRDEARRTLSVDGRSGGVVLRGQPTVILLVGVNGAGKTTTIGKLAAQLSQSGNKVTLAAGDTFRAAAVDQLRAWGERVGCEVIAGKDGADPSSVLFDAVLAAKENGSNVLLADTAGRLHTKTNLMQEMTKIQKTISKALPGAPHEILLVIDATNGQNAMAQAREFKEALDLTGLILTKLDGTARGGAVLGICDVLQLPIRYIGVGERTEQLYEFDTDAFVEALLGADNDSIPS